jgi:hypothetical protein
MAEFVGSRGYETYSSPEEIVGFAASVINRTGVYGQTVVESYLQAAGRADVSGKGVSYFFMPGKWLRPDEVALFSRVGIGQWQETILKPEHRLRVQGRGSPIITTLIDHEPRLITDDPEIVEKFMSTVTPKNQREEAVVDSFYDVFHNLRQAEYVPTAENLVTQALEELSDERPGWFIMPEDVAKGLVKQDFLNDFYERVAALQDRGRLAKMAGQLKLLLGATNEALGR